LALALFLSSIPAVLLVFFTHRNVPESEAWIEKNRERTELRTAEGSATPDAYTPGERAILGRFTLVALFAQKDLRRSLLLCILMSFGTIGGYWAVSTWIPVYVETVARAGGYTSMNWAALGGAVFSLGSIPGYLAGGYLAESWVGRRGMLAFYFTGSLVSIAAVYLWADAPLSLLIATFLHGFFTQGQFVWFAIYPPELFPTAVRGSAIATVFNVARGLSLLAPIFSGVLISQFGGYSTMALTFGALYLLALVAVPFSAETRGKPLPH
jgi:MFS family permease